ncbi:efflux RND transporter periplasmic adaptor subunit [Lyngbya confervoides]|uniref:Efflux RND transporter periplasmic adaptor subunit n=1 Tax=Lyngbya confervoides BDU141951 TaxID=1574623 RepID=A0ABD4T5F6_9CYAN|nr:efflux RND transporter periplasmic adaptor subunit [Lyngbya confervoides]MCM1983942.1 efflux RND transporter periplasmic adaptor subunit [Lyngbya confervoides BDU141951]
MGRGVLTTALFVATAGCSVVRDQAVEAQGPSNRGRRQSGPVSVDVAIAQQQLLSPPVQYTGTTQPLREVSLRAQAEGKLLFLGVDVGDRVEAGQTVAQLDDNLLQGALNEARAESAAQQSAVLSARSRVGSATTQVGQARLSLEQAQGNIARLKNAWRARIEDAKLEAQQTQSDAQRLTTLATQGAVPEQQAEQARTVARQAQQALLDQQAQASQEITQSQTEANIAQQLLQAAQAQVQIEQQGVTASQGQLAARRASQAQAEERRSYGTLTAPLRGVVLARTTEEGNLVQAGNEILKIGDFSQVKVIVQVSELNLQDLQVNQPAQVRLDAFPDQTFSGRVSRISPAADPQTRLLPVEITLPNPSGKIGSGLLARVTFAPETARVVIPETALTAGTRERRGGGGPAANAGTAPPQAKRQPSDQDKKTPSPASNDQKPRIFLLKSRDEDPLVEARPVQLGKRANGEVEVLSGLKPGEFFVVRSSGPLQSGDAVQLSFLSPSPQGAK